jgi:pyrroline-5-carboxylate reductase
VVGTGYGFVGAGEITAAIVRGLSADITDPPTIFLSPRGRAVGRDLAGRFPNVHVCGSNHEVLENATAIVLAVRPSSAREVLTELSFRQQHVLMSALAGVPLADLHSWSAPAGQVVRVIPLPHAARRQSLTVMYPDNALAQGLFTRVGEVLVAADEQELDAFSSVTATFAAHVDYLNTITDWLADHGVEHGVATAYTMRIFGQLGQSLLQSPESLAAVTKKYMTPGGINEQLMTDLRHEGVPAAVRHALDRIFTRLRG